jgi:hypothetical protein
MYGIFVNHDLFFNPKQSFQDGDICQPWTQSSLSHDHRSVISCWL